MDNNFGVIDLGSNTFHLLIVKRDEDGSYVPIFKERSFVGLSENGIDKLSDSSMQKGLATLCKFKEILNEKGVKQYSVIGTSALRSASNSSDFLDKVKDQLGIDIEVIDGNREAELICKGVTSILPPNDQCQVIIDVGGGSVEFIIVDKGHMIWAQSYNLGVGVLYNYARLSDPCNKEELVEISEFISKKLESLKSVVSEKNINAVIGASGSFEVVQTINGDSVSSNALTEVSLDDYRLISKRIISSTVDERMSIDGLPKSRVKLIVVAMILIDKALEIISPQKLLVSPYALKEGVLSELGE